jgi:hypothetical protein
MICVHLCCSTQQTRSHMPTCNKQDHICSPKQVKTQRKLEPSIWSTSYEIHWNSLSKPNPRSSLHPQKGGARMNQQHPAHHMEGLCTIWMDKKQFSNWFPGLKVYGSKNSSFNCLIQPSGGTQVHTVREGQEGRIALSYPPIVLSSYLQDLQDWQCEGQCQLSWGSSTS